MHTVTIDNVTIGGDRRFALMAGPCVIEDRKTVMAIAGALKKITDRLEVPFVFKASYDKANRTSIASFRGPGLKKGLGVLAAVKKEFDVPVVSDVHSVEEVGPAAEVLDILQIPAFLCRQTDLLVTAAKTGKIVNVKKGQFLAPWDMEAVVRKIEAAGSRRLLLTERGASFGYNNLVTDFRSLAVMRGFGYPVVLDASHSVQQPGGLGTASGGKSEDIPLLARCGVAAGCDALFMETHLDPKAAKSDGPNMLPLDRMEDLLLDLIAIDAVVKTAPAKRSPAPGKSRKRTA